MRPKQELFREDGLSEGIHEGQREGYFQTLASFGRDEILSVMDAASRAGLTEGEFTAQMAPTGI